MKIFGSRLILAIQMRVRFAKYVAQVLHIFTATALLLRLPAAGAAQAGASPFPVLDGQPFQRQDHHLRRTPPNGHRGARAPAGRPQGRHRRRRCRCCRFAAELVGWLRLQPFLSPQLIIKLRRRSGQPLALHLRLPDPLFFFFFFSFPPKNKFLSIVSVRTLHARAIRCCC
jgi:hypothetical protein